MMYHRDLHTAMCRGKVRYRTWKEANRSLRLVVSKSRKGDTPMSVYRCRFCNDYHFGHDMKK